MRLLLAGVLEESSNAVGYWGNGAGGYFLHLRAIALGYHGFPCVYRLACGAAVQVHAGFVGPNELGLRF